MEKDSRFQKPSPQYLTMLNGDCLLMIIPIMKTTKVKTIANKNGSGKYFCTNFTKKFDNLLIIKNPPVIVCNINIAKTVPKYGLFDFYLLIENLNIKNIVSIILITLNFYFA
jgi:energy-converting hydrogenase Eha subunit H